jgi:hypothetical protein
MNRYILLSFLFMGWTFYELSGGADFEPPRATQVAMAEKVAESQIQTQRDVTELMTPEPVAEPVAKPDPIALPEVSTKLSLVAEPVLTNAPEDLIVAAINAEIPVTTGIVMPSDWLTESQAQTVGTDTVFSLASLGQLPETVPETVSQDPIWGTRTVKGSEVNVRSGPGTDRSVVSSLIGGTEVEVLNDPGEGWVKMRHTDSETAGWMAASRLSP